MPRKTIAADIAKALGISTATVHRALYGHSYVSPLTRERVLHMAKELEYVPNQAARNLSLRRNLQISVNLLRGISSFFDDVVAGIQEESLLLGQRCVEIQVRTYPHIGVGEEEQFEAALDAGADGIITWMARPEALRTALRRATRNNVPVVCVTSDAPGSGRLAVVSADNKLSGALAADLLGVLLQGKGKVGITIAEAGVAEHAEKLDSFQHVLAKFYPGLLLLPAIEDENIEAVAYEKCRSLFSNHPDLCGLYVSTDASIPAIQAARDMGILENLKIVATDLFPALIDEIKSGAVQGTIFQRPKTQGRTAFKVIYQFLSERRWPRNRLTIAPHLITKGSLDFFLQRNPQLARIAETG